MRGGFVLPAALCAAAALAACSAGGGEAGDAAVARGQKLYKNACITCHHPDAAKEGAVGPAVAGASRELLEARVIRGEYPPGYTPKRPGNVMPPMPHLKQGIDDLAAYLASVAPSE